MKIHAPHPDCRRAGRAGRLQRRRRHHASIPPRAPPTVADYTGPAPATADVQSFRINLWDNIKANNRCGGCHNATGQTPRFARNDDVNLAYADANTVVNLTQPDQSRMVLKVGGGHNCWLSSNSGLRRHPDHLDQQLGRRRPPAAARRSQLQAPDDRGRGLEQDLPGPPPTAVASFASTIYPLVRRRNCLRCHSPTAATPQSPFFASADVERGLCRGARQDRPRHAGQLALRTCACATRIAQLLDHRAAPADSATMLARDQPVRERHQRRRRSIRTWCSARR